MTTATLPDTHADRGRGTWIRRNRQMLAPILFLAPGVLFFMLYVIFPIVESFQISFYRWDGLGQPQFVGLDNYRELGSDPAFEVSLWNNLKWLVLYLLAIPGGLFIALFLNQTVTGIRIYKSLFFFPFVISQVVVGLVFTWFYDPTFGLLNTLLEGVGLGPVNMLGDPRLATYGIILAGLWPQVAYCMILYLTGLNAVDPEQVEAARLDQHRGRLDIGALDRHAVAVVLLPEAGEHPSAHLPVRQLGRVGAGGTRQGGADGVDVVHGDPHRGHPLRAARSSRHIDHRK